MKNEPLELRELKLLFDAGALKSATIVSAPLSEGYQLLLSGKNAHHAFKGQRDEHTRTFKTIDAAAKSARNIGFKTVTLQLN